MFLIQFFLIHLLIIGVVWKKRRFKCTLCLEIDTSLEKVQRLTKRIQEMLIKHDDIIDESVIVKFDSNFK